ncbi:MAG: hypothetical protein ACI8W7_003776 [Gammaproteobacteria bacterium]|jgi:hypothetical protein
MVHSNGEAEHPLACSALDATKREASGLRTSGLISR